MSNYRRNRVEGGSYFFTDNLHDRRSDLMVAEIETLRRAVRATQGRHPFHNVEADVTDAGERA